MKERHMTLEAHSDRNLEDVEISVVMPCLNEAATLKTCIMKVKRCFDEHNLKGEIIVVDNGSTDGSQQIATSCGARLVHQSIKGYGAALCKGFESARGKYILMADADDSYDFLDTYRFVEKLREGNEMVMGTRLKGEIKPGAMPWLHRYIGNPMLTFILKFLYCVSISDAHCGMRAFQRNKLEKMDLRTPGMEFASEMIIKAVRGNMKITEIPIVLSPDGRSRRPHLRSFPDGWRHLRLMLMLAPGFLFVLPGLALLMIGLIMESVILVGGPLNVGTVKFAENTMLLFMMTAILGSQMSFLGFFIYLFITPASLLQNDPQNKLILKYSKFERGAALGAILLLIGFIGDAVVFSRWQAGGFGDLDRLSIRQFIFFSTFVILGIQTIFSSFLLNMIGIDRAIYSGDRHS